MAIIESTVRAGARPRVATPTQPSALSRYGATALAAAIGLGALYLVSVVYAVGQTLLAVIMLILVAAAVWTYTSTKTLALRYLFPALAAAAIFVVFPMMYTVGIGFTNYSSNNLLSYERARRFFLEETFRAPGPAYAFTMLADGGKFRLRLEDQDDDKRVFVSPAITLAAAAPVDVKLEAYPGSAAGDPLTMKDVIARQAALKALRLTLPDGANVRMSSVRLFAPVQPRYKPAADGSLVDVETGAVLTPNRDTGFFETAAGDAKQPGFTVSVGFAHFKRMFADGKFSEPFLRIFIWTVVFSALTVFFAAGLGLFLATLLNWDALRFKGTFRLLLFLPYAVPSFISILIFKGLFNQNLGEINVVLNGLFGIKPAWFADPFLAKTMLLIVNTWLGFPYMMVICMGLIKSISADLYEASAVAGAGPLTNFFQITMPLILKPLTPLLISSFAFNFNNFVLITLLTGGAPDYLDTNTPAGTTDILVSYTNRIAFQDSGSQFGLASAISTIIFLMVAALTLVQLRLTRANADNK